MCMGRDVPQDMAVVLYNLSEEKSVPLTDFYAISPHTCTMTRLWSSRSHARSMAGTLPLCMAHRGIRVKHDAAHYIV